MNTIKDTKPKSSMSGGFGSFQSSSITYNDSTVQYSSGTAQYGGFYGLTDEAPVNIEAFASISKIKSAFIPTVMNLSVSSTVPNFIGLITQVGLTQGQRTLTAGQPIGLLLTLAYPEAETVDL